MERPLKFVAEDIFFGPVLILILLSLSLLLMYRQRHNYKLSFRILFVSWAFLLLGSNTLFFQAVSAPLKYLTPKSEKHLSDAIVVASAGVHGSGAPTPGSTLRAHAAGKLYLEGFAPVVIITGGVTKPYLPPVDIKGMAIILQGMGVPPQAIIIENRSADTYKNGIETLKILQRLKYKTVLLVSHDYHLFRLASVFKKLGIESYTFAANQSYPKKAIPWWRYFEWANFNRIQTIFHEYFGLLSYKYFGRI
ncbi:MAG: YdcF family protein [SAR324 cluster bacterium]|nr:YdcF family protein [SAR324 cluster bacterium]MBL7036129.1 YdcF family protein [SAR324 cluster bacterium]